MESEIKLNIEACVTRQLAVNLNPDYSLLGGCLGQVLYLFFSSECNDEKYERACRYLDKVFFQSFTLCVHYKTNTIMISGVAKSRRKDFLFEVWIFESKAAFVK